MSPESWLAARTAGAPAALRTRVLGWTEGGGGTDEEILAQAGLAALATSLTAPQDRSAALDLLAADALVTLALQARAERDPAALGAWARHLRQAGAALR